jgi:hypothetical protein
VSECILSGELVWINGPYDPGIWNDIAISLNALLTELDEGKRVKADDGYRGKAPRYIKSPAQMEAQAAFV